MFLVFPRGQVKAAIFSTSFPGSFLYFEKGPWERGCYFFFLWRYAKEGNIASLPSNKRLPNRTLDILLFCFVGPDSSWPFDDLHANNIETHGKVEKTMSPVGHGIYLDDSRESFVEIKNYDEGCMGNPSTCDITMGFFFKHTTRKNRVTYFGNKGNNDDLYRGINMHCKQEEHYKCYISVYGQTKYCHCRFFLFYGVWQYIGLIWEKAGRLTLYHDSGIVEAHKSNRCTCNKTGELKTGKYYLGKDTFPSAYFKDLDIWYSKQVKEVLDDKWFASFGKYFYL